MVFVKNLKPENEDSFKDTTLSDRAYEFLLQMIVHREVEVGKRLPTEYELSETLRLSRPIVRRALKQLRNDGVIVSRQGSGSYVQRRPESAVLKFSPKGSFADIQRAFEFRSAIEGEAAYFCALRRTDKELECIQDALIALDKCIDSNELGSDADALFHEAICVGSHNHYYTTARTSMKGSILTGINLTRNLSLMKSQEQMKNVQSEHYLIFQAIKDQDATSAQQAMRLHLDNARMRVFEENESKQS